LFKSQIKSITKINKNWCEREIPGEVQISVRDRERRERGCCERVRAVRERGCNQFFDVIEP